MTATREMADNAGMLALFTLTVLVSATLLFLVQPMFARMVLPLLGGTPAVWNTALVFYQVVLLAGYGYAHLLTSRLHARSQAIIHTLVVLAAFAILPIAVPRGWSPPTESNPVPWVLALLAVGVGLPFFVVSTTGPLMQRWFSGSAHPSARDPYFLYAASNVGSMVGLLGYPFLIEPALRLRQQSTMWTAGYVLLALLVAACAWQTGRAHRRVDAAAAIAGPPVPARRRLRWLLLAFIPSSLMMGATTHITTDVAAIPLLWVLPLALYLASFILVFAKRPPLPHLTMARAWPLVVLPLMIVMQVHAIRPLPLIVGLHLLLVFVSAMVCHGELARDRPAPSQLTMFYLVLAAGGALGGIFNAIVAPLAFRSVLEYPIAIVLAAMALPNRSNAAPGLRTRVLDVAIPVLMGGIVIGCYALVTSMGLVFGFGAVALLYALLAFPLRAMAKRPVRFGLAIAAVLLADPTGLATRGQIIHEQRTFFGVLRVDYDASRQFHRLIHGTTVHGMQWLGPNGCREPIGYYHARGPAGDVFRALGRPGLRAGLAGLGAGELAAYSQPGQHWTCYEIDPAVRDIASNTSYFCFLANSKVPVRTVLGDARRMLQATDERYDMIVLDAYSSDVIPLHMITREAVALYQSRLTPGGVMVFHLSNRYFDLVPVVARLAEDAKLTCRVRELHVTDAQLAQHVASSTWAALANRPEDLGALMNAPEWAPPKTRAGLRVWTDDYASLLSVLK